MGGQSSGFGVLILNASNRFYKDVIPWKTDEEICNVQATDEEELAAWGMLPKLAWLSGPARWDCCWEVC